MFQVTDGETDEQMYSTIA